MISTEQFGKLVETMQDMHSTVGALIKEIERIEAEKQILADEVLSLPIWPSIDPEVQERVVGALREAVGG